MNASEIREKPTDELLHELHALEAQMLKFRFERVTERELRPSEIQRTRKDIARIKTILKEREMKRKEEKTGEVANG